MNGLYLYMPLPAWEKRVEAEANHVATRPDGGGDDPRATLDDGRGGSTLEPQPAQGEGRDGMRWDP